MSEPLSADQIGVAVAAFLAAMRREFIKRNGVDVECRVPKWSEMSVEDRGVLVRSMRQALAAPYNEEALRRFREQQSSDNLAA
ncbi:MAG: hypothetical protein WA156_17265 [Methylocystis silviterrae]